MFETDTNTDTKKQQPRTPKKKDLGYNILIIHPAGIARIGMLEYHHLSDQEEILS